jgi:ABC-type spermidine/putrescine transport system permease subunit II
LPIVSRFPTLFGHRPIGNEQNYTNKLPMANLRGSVVKMLQSKRIHRSAGAIAGFASAMSVLVGMLAAYATPRGWGRVSMVLHITKKPFIMKLAPMITGVAVAIATAAGLLGFYLWVVERSDDPPEGKPGGEA